MRWTPALMTHREGSKGLAICHRKGRFCSQTRWDYAVCNRTEFPKTRALTSHLTKKETEAQRGYNVSSQVTQVVPSRARIQISRSPIKSPSHLQHAVPRRVQWKEPWAITYRPWQTLAKPPRASSSHCPVLLFPPCNVRDKRRGLSTSESTAGSSEITCESSFFKA